MKVALRRHADYNNLNQTVVPMKKEKCYSATRKDGRVDFDHDNDTKTTWLSGMVRG